MRHELRPENLRRHPRYVTKNRCAIYPAVGDRLLANHVLDLSYSGLHVSALAPARIGERVRISLEIPGTSFFIDAEGEVIRCVVGRRADDPGPSFGVSLERMHGFDRVLMANFARGRPTAAATSRRGARRDYAQTILRIAEG